MKILSLSDKIVSFLYSPQVTVKFGDIDLIVACGDLPYYYQEYILTSLNKPLFFVRGNHDSVIEYGEKMSCDHPQGGIDLHGKNIRHKGILLGGVEGSIRYNKQSVFQYTQNEMWMHVIRLIPGLIFNRLFHGRFIDIFVTHAPPKGIHEGGDIPHQGIKAFKWFIQVFKPKIHVHGHIHVYRPDTITETKLNETRIINTFGYKVFEIPGEIQK